MDTDGNNVAENTPVKETALKHQVGRMLVSGLATIVADQLAGKAYDKALRVYRSRKSA